MNELRPADRIAELLTERLERELSDEEARELDGLLAKEASWSSEDFELAATATFLAFHGPPEVTLPPKVAEQLRVDAPANLPGPHAAVPESHVPPGAGEDGAPHASEPDHHGSPHHDEHDEHDDHRSHFVVRHVGSIAVAACLLVAVYLWLRPPGPPAGSLVAEQPAPAAAPRVADDASRRTELIGFAGSVHRPWTPTEDPLASGVSGDVVWHGGTQKGYMRFRGLPKNDPGANQYQLWIFDATRDARHPVDGGVFDVGTDASDVVVPIDAKLEVRQATMFAITLEKPGGVVVSSRERLLVLAKVDG